MDQKTIYAESSLSVDEILKRVDYRLILYAVTALAEGKTGMAHSLDHWEVLEAGFRQWCERIILEIDDWYTGKLGDLFIIPCSSIRVQSQYIDIDGNSWLAKRL